MGSNLKKIELESIIGNNFPDQSFCFDFIPDTFSSTSYINPICSIHGNFSILPYRFKKIGCPKCKNVRNGILGNNTKVTREEFIKRSNIIHSSFYDYSMVKFKKTSDIGQIVCPIHGSFYQKLSNHLSGQGCPVCGKIVAANKLKTKATELFDFEIFSEYVLLSEQKDLYLDTDKLSFQCELHGVFEKSVHNIKLGQKCPKCKSTEIGLSKRYSESEFLELITISNNVEYVPGSFIKVVSPVLFKCDSHGEFLLNRAYYAIQNIVKCPICNISSFELDVISFVESLGVGHIKHYRPEWMDGKELDIFFPEFNVAIEVNGSYWHSEKFKYNWYHFDKTKKCKENSVILLHIWEHYWKIDPKKEIYKSKIKHLLQMDIKIFARKCSIKKIEESSAKLFHVNNHLEGFGIFYRESFSVGLENNGIIYMVATIGLFFNQNQKKFEWKLQRVSTKNGFTIVGGVSKLVKKLKSEIGDFIFQVTLDTGGSILKEYKQEDTISLRYWWVNGSSNFKTRNECQSSKLKLNSDWMEDDNEKSYMERNNWFRVWDSGICTLKI